MNIKEIKAMSASELSKTLKEKKEELLHPAGMPAWMKS